MPRPSWEKLRRSIRTLNHENWVDIEHRPACAAPEQNALGADRARNYHRRRRGHRDGRHRKRRESAGRSADRESRAKCDPDFFWQHNFERHSHRLGRRGHVEDRGRGSDSTRSAGRGRG